MRVGNVRFDGLPLFACAPRSRRVDRQTSVDAGNSIPISTPSHAALLEAFRSSADGLTDEEAAEIAGLHVRTCWWKRCSELRAAGLIVETGRTRKGSSGRQRIVCVVPT